MLDAAGADGVTRRSTLETAARHGAAVAAEALEGPGCPDGFEYLLTWARELHGRSGIGMTGVAPLSLATLDAWSRLSGVDPSPEETRALLALDTVLLNPTAPDPAP